MKKENLDPHNAISAQERTAKYGLNVHIGITTQTGLHILQDIARYIVKPFGFLTLSW